MLANSPELSIKPAALGKALTLYFTASKVILAFCCLLDDDRVAVFDFFFFPFGH